MGGKLGWVEERVTVSSMFYRGKKEEERAGEADIKG